MLLDFIVFPHNRWLYRFQQEFSIEFWARQFHCSSGKVGREPIFEAEHVDVIGPSCGAAAAHLQDVIKQVMNGCVWVVPDVVK